MRYKILLSIVVILAVVTATAQTIKSGYLSGYFGLMNPNYVATIASSGTTSTSISTGGMALCGILLPATFTGTTLTFQASVDNVTFVAVKSTTSGTALSYTVAQNTFAAIDPKDFQGIKFLKIVSGSTEGATRTLAVSLKGL